MKYLPFEHFDIYTDLSSDEVFRRLCAAIDMKRKWLIFLDRKFAGDVTRNYFKIWRLTWWNQNFTPVVSGIIQSDEVGCRLQIKMRIPWYSFLFYSFAFGFVWLSFFMGNANLIVQKIQTGIWQIESFGEWLLNVVLYIVFLAFIYFISVGTFKWEAYRIIAYLLRLVRAKRDKLVYYDQILGVKEYQILRALFVIPLVISIGWMAFKLLQ